MDRTGVSRRTVLRGLLATGAVAASGPFFLRHASAQKTLKIGHLNTFSGGNAEIGHFGRWGLQMALQRIEATGGINGMKIEVFEEDDAFDTGQARRQLEKLILRHDVDVVTGVSSSAVCVAIAPVVLEHKILFMLGTGCETPSLTQDPSCNRFVFRPYNSTKSQAIAMAPWGLKNVGKKWFSIYNDFKWGQSVHEDFKTELERLGGHVIGAVAPPLNTQDYQPYLSRVETTADGLVVGIPGADAIRVVKQMHAMGLTKRMRVIGPASVVGIDTLSGQGESAVGIYTLHRYPVTSSVKGTILDDEPNRKFREHFTKVSGKQIPAGYTQAQYTGLLLMAQAMRAVGYTGRQDTGKVIKWLENEGKGRTISKGLDNPQGELFLRAEDHQGFTDFYVLAVNSRLEFEIVGPPIPWKDTVYPARCSLKA